MQMPDVNVLLAAFRKEHPHHAPARAWLDETLAAVQTANGLGLLPAVVTSFLRMATNHRVFPHPAPMKSAMSFVDALMAQPGVEWLNQEHQWPQFRTLCLDGKLEGNAMPDAWIAASASALGAKLVTFDRDFSKLLSPREWLLLKG